MELRRTEQGFALYKEKDCIGTCAVRPAAKGADITAAMHKIGRAHV